MEPADPTKLHQKLGQQGAILEAQQQQLLMVMQCVQTMTHQMADLSTSVRAMPPVFAPWASSSSAASSAPPDPGSALPPLVPIPGFHEPHLPPPERYDGEPGDCRSFLTQCQLLFNLPHHPNHCPSQALDIRQPPRDHLSTDHRHSPLSCHPGSPVDGHTQPRDGLEEARDLGLESCLLDKMFAKSPLPGFCSSVR